MNAHVVCSRVNIIYTLSLKYQLRLCYRLHLKIGLVDNIDYGKVRKLDLRYYPDLPLLLSRSKLFEIYSLNFNGINFKIKIKLDSNAPQFGVISAIIFNENTEIWFYIKNLPILIYAPTSNHMN